MTVKSIQSFPSPVKRISTASGIVLLMDCWPLGCSPKEIGACLGVEVRLHAEAPLDNLADGLIVPLTDATSYAEAWGRLVVQRLLSRRGSS